MATSRDVFSVGFPVEGPTVQELDALPTRLAQVRGARQGAEQAAIGAVRMQLDQISALAQRSSDVLAGAIEEPLTSAAQTSLQTAQTATDAINQLLEPVRLTARQYAPSPPPSRRRSRNGAQPPAPIPLPGAPPAPPGCTWIAPPPGSDLPAHLYCQPIGAVPPPQAVPPGVTGPDTTSPGATLPTPAQLTYWILVNCHTRQAAAVPNLTPADLRQLEMEGWKPVDPTVCPACPDYQTALAYLTAQRARLAALCGNTSS